MERWFLIYVTVVVHFRAESFEVLDFVFNFHESEFFFVEYICRGLPLHDYRIGVAVNNLKQPSVNEGGEFGSSA